MKIRTLKRIRQSFAWCVYWGKVEEQDAKKKRTKWNREQSYRDYNGRIRRKGRHFKPGTVIETCGVDVARIKEIDGRDITYEYMFGRYTSSTGSCCLMNCGPVRLNPAAIERRRQIFEREGYQGMVRRYWREDCHMTNEQIAEAEAHDKKWRGEA